MEKLKDIIGLTLAWAVAMVAVYFIKEYCYSVGWLDIKDDRFFINAMKISFYLYVVLVILKIGDK